MTGNEFLGVLKIIGVGIAAWSGIYLLKFIAISLGRLFERALLPIERRLLTWLQDRATARVLGIDTEIVRQRRKMETTDKTINY